MHSLCTLTLIPDRNIKFVQKYKVCTRNVKFACTVTITIIKVLKTHSTCKCLDAFYNYKKELLQNRYVFKGLLKLSTELLCLMASSS